MDQEGVAKLGMNVTLTAEILSACELFVCKLYSSMRRLATKQMTFDAGYFVKNDRK